MDSQGQDKSSSQGATARAAGEAAPGIERHDVKAVNKAEHRELYKKREPIFPKRVYGTFRNAKWAIMAITLGIYYLLPWVRWDRGPGVPDQAVLVDFGAPRFYFFFIEIWPQEIYYITGLLVMAAIGLFLITSLFGRVWCGYACPQTVWTDLFVWVERLIQGDRNARIKLAKAPWTADKIRKIGITHSIWIVISIATGGAWVFYFSDAPTLMGDLLSGSASTSAYLFIGILTFTTYSLGGLMREQVCIYMCPWPRIQAAMIDNDALAVTYDTYRGEPRGPHKKGATWDDRGHCISCRQCVVACPMGIDIRDGLQLECTQCALCIDACDSIMTKLDLPKGLIAYDTDINIAKKAKGEEVKFRFFRARTAFYSAILIFIGGLMVFGLSSRDFLELNVLRDRIPNFVTLSDGSVRNGYTVKIVNMGPDQGDYHLTLEGIEGATFRITGDPVDHTVLPTFEVGGDTVRSIRIYVSLPANHLPDEAQTPVTFVVDNMENGIQKTARSVFVTGENH